jgi:hypothetical protein
LGSQTLKFELLDYRPTEVVAARKGQNRIHRFLATETPLR